MTKRGRANFPGINLISLLAGALALASVFLPWWGMDASGFGSSVSSRWTLWNGPSTDSIFRGSTQPYPTLTSASPINTCAAPSFRGHELSSPNCGPTGRWAKICSNWEVISTIESVLGFVSETSRRRSLGFPRYWWCRLYSPCRMFVRDMHRSASKARKVFT